MRGGGMGGGGGMRGGGMGGGGGMRGGGMRGGEWVVAGIMEETAIREMLICQELQRLL